MNSVNTGWVPKKKKKTKGETEKARELEKTRETIREKRIKSKTDQRDKYLKMSNFILVTSFFYPCSIILKPYRKSYLFLYDFK